MGERKRKLASGQAPDARAAISRAVELLRSGNPEQARALCEPFFEAALSDPEAVHYLGYLAIELGRPDRDLRPDLLGALVHDEVEPKSLVRTVISLLRNTPQFEEARRLAEQDALASAPEKGRAALHDPLLLRLLESTIVTDAVMERML